MTEERWSEPRESGDEFLPRLAKDLHQVAALNTPENLLTLNSQDDQLLPGLPNEIVLDEIVPKLSWKIFYTLSLVSRSWRQAIRNHEVYDARVRSHSNETLLVYNDKVRVDNQYFKVTENLSLYSVRDKSWLQLPPLPQPQRRIPDCSRFVSLDGKIYVLAGETECYYSGDSLSGADLRTVYVLDLAGQRDWKRCANMLESRLWFVCGAINGKIYVFGQSHSESHIQVYDPKENAWSMVLVPFMERYFNRTCKNCLTIGEELFVDIDAMDEEVSWDHADFYHPRRNEWRRAESVQFFDEGELFRGLFTAHGKLHRMTSSGIDVYQVDENLWTRLHSIQSPPPYPGDPQESAEIVATDNDEFFVLVQPGMFGYFLFQGKGFGKEGKEITWEKRTCPFRYGETPWNVQRFICTIQI